MGYGLRVYVTLEYSSISIEEIIFTLFFWKLSLLQKKEKKASDC